MYRFFGFFGGLSVFRRRLYYLDLYGLFLRWRVFYRVSLVSGLCGPSVALSVVCGRFPCPFRRFLCLSVDRWRLVPWSDALRVSCGPSIGGSFSGLPALVGCFAALPGFVFRPPWAFILLCGFFFACCRFFVLWAFGCFAAFGSGSAFGRGGSVLFLGMVCPSFFRVPFGILCGFFCCHCPVLPAAGGGPAVVLRVGL